MMPSSTTSSLSEGVIPVDGEKHEEGFGDGSEANEQQEKKQQRQQQHGATEAGILAGGGGGGGDQGGRRGGTATIEQENETGDEWAVEPEILDTDADGVAGTMNRVLSRISTKSSWNPGPPPDGGKLAWIQCICGHLVIMNTWGLINSFGIFQTYYNGRLGRPASDISWIGSIAVWLTFFIGTFTGRFTDAGFFKPCLLTGTGFMMLGVFATSAATEYWQLVLSQGLCVGIGCGFLFCPAITTVSTYFSKKRSLAIGLAACGSVTGGMVFPAMARQLLPSVGFPWAMRAIGFVQLATLLTASTFMKSRLPPRRSGNLVEWGAFKELEYTFFAAGMFFNFLGIYFAFYYLSAYSRTQISPPLSYSDSLNLLLVLNGVAVIGRVLPNFLADTYGPLNLLIPHAFSSGVMVLCWIAIRRPAGLYAWSAFYGITSGGVQSLFPAGLSSLTTDLRKQGTRMGMVFTIVSFATLTGNPIAGAIIGAMDGNYVGAQCFSGLCFMMGTALLLVSRYLMARRDGKKFLEVRV